MTTSFLLLLKKANEWVRLFCGLLWTDTHLYLRANHLPNLTTLISLIVMPYSVYHGHKADTGLPWSQLNIQKNSDQIHLPEEVFN